VEVRTRIAPSNSGIAHLGTARTALYNYLFAKQNNGKFLIRIEDTDTERSTEAFLKNILDALEWLGLKHDEEIVYQSHNRSKHLEAVRKLLDVDLAYYDFTPPRELSSGQDIKAKIAQNAKTAGNRRDNPWRSASFRVIPQNIPYCIRLKVPDCQDVEFDDLVFGRQVRNTNDIEDLVLVRSDGTPLYNLAVVCDDIEMRITHIIRGQDHLTNTFKQVLIYKALGAELPKFAHLPLIFAPGKKKLSKRTHGEIVSVGEYKKRGFLPEGLLNYLALLGWSPGNNEEVMSMERMIEVFDLKRVHKSPAIFNFDPNNAKSWTDDKAMHINAQHLRNMNVEDLAHKLSSFMYDYVQNLPTENGVRQRFREGFSNTLVWKTATHQHCLSAIRKVDEARQYYFDTINLLRPRYNTLEDFVIKGYAFFSDDFDYSENAVKLINDRQNTIRNLLNFIEAKWDNKHTSEGLLNDATNLFEFDVRGLLRALLTGQTVGPNTASIMDILGKERILYRVNNLVTN
jgi:glutamyl-tRNA synthetase